MIPSRGFTLIELIVSLGIFAIMTALVVAKYGNFNQTVLFTNLAYDTALVIRTAQTYGLSVRREGTGIGDFQHAYGVQVTTRSSGSENKEIILYSDSNDSKKYEPSDTVVSRYNIKRGAYISETCTLTSGTETCWESSGPSASVNHNVNITFKRPDPNAVIYRGGNTTVPSASRLRIELTGTDGSTRNVIVMSNGQISVEN